MIRARASLSAMKWTLVHFAHTKIWAWMSIVKWEMVHLLNKVLQPIGLRLTMRSYYDELLRTRYEHFNMAHRVEQLEEELEELTAESEVQG